MDPAHPPEMAAAGRRLDPVPVSRIGEVAQRGGQVGEAHPRRARPRLPLDADRVTMATRVKGQPVDAADGLVREEHDRIGISSCNGPRPQVCRGTALRTGAGPQRQVFLGSRALEALFEGFTSAAARDLS
jgi:hypothetical protein